VREEEDVGYRTLLVHLEQGHSNADLLQIAGDLSQVFDAGVIGMAALPPVVDADGNPSLPEAFVDPDRLASEMESMEAEFRDALHARAGALEFRTAHPAVDLAEAISRQARSADLIVTCPARGDRHDASRALNTGALVMQAGRPVLLVPPSAVTLTPARIMIGWKDTRETRRAVADAVPFLQRATEVRLIEIVAEGHMDAAWRDLDDLLKWLKHHGVSARAGLIPSNGGDDASQLHAAAEREACDVIVAGVYGHRRFREWMLGGVTRDLLLSPKRCSLVSH
jgi:nucleotide-binding universal stress UspA family protein